MPDFGLIIFLLMVAAYLVAIVIAYLYGGWKLALAVATIGVAYLAYKFGQKDKTDYYTKETKIIEKKRQDAYDEIDNRGTDRDDVLKRLRDNSY